jgi:hypothetical protein
LLSASDLPQPWNCPRFISIRFERVSSLPLRPQNGRTGHKSRLLVLIHFLVSRVTGNQEPHIATDLVTVVCIVVFVLKLKANHGQSRMTRLMRTILQDGVLYFFVMAAFHLTMVLCTFFTGVTTSLPLVRRCA